MQVKLQQGVIITGNVVGPQNKPLADAKVYLMLMTEGYNSPVGEWRKEMTNTSTDGAFTIKAIPLGQRYQLDVTAYGYGKATRQIHTDEAVNHKLDVGRLLLAE